ncbi:thymidine kinase, cytosolic-like [Acropora muricata]|uniref:thymidine kinase, cytosolic-like n=2 Tax=Acropora TaxID=6127 RepID=UPI0034E58505
MWGARGALFKISGAISSSTGSASTFLRTAQRFTTCKMSMVTISGMDVHGVMNIRGQIQVIFGPMFSGKTTELLRRIKRYQVANHSCIVIKYEKDNRYDAGGVATHDRQTLRASSCSVLEDIKEKAQDYSVIGIDEGQFFPDIVQFSEEMAGLGKVIIVAALDGTFQREPFGPILKLVPLAESVVKLSAVCMHCYRDAAFTKRLGAEKKVEVIGGADKYMAVCRDCYHFSPVHGVLAGSPIKYNYH